MPRSLCSIGLHPKKMLALAMILSDTLEAQGFEMRTAHDGEEGLRMFAEQKPAGTPPSIPDSVVVDLVNKQKRKKSLFMTFVALVVLAAVGMAGYGYYSKHKTEAVLLDSLFEDSMVTVKEQKLKPDTTIQNSIKQDTTQNE